MTARGVVGMIAVALIAAGSWYLAARLGKPEAHDDTGNTFSGGFYLRSARILGMGDEGNLLYEILAEYAEQKAGQEIVFQNVRINYSPRTSIPWTLNADTATIAGVGQAQEQVILSGHVRAVSTQGFSGEVTEIRTPYLELEPETFRAETDARVQIRIGSRSLTATGMLALLEENRLQLKSNVSGRFVP
ncbi:MAG TPA: LPS export ABC transporter periplasmic protein LptC [Woeseiaceae bacterium]|nr:LPS export ABC transporter periplasmic protein LptC [Woeseiaceae bacterium]